MSEIPVGQIIQISEGTWIKTDRGWRIRGREFSDTVAAPTATLRHLRPGVRNNNRELSQARNVIVTGSKTQRRVTVCFSAFIEHIDMFGAATDQRRFNYLFDLLQMLLKTHLSHMSGTAHGKLFRILEEMVDYVTSREVNIKLMKQLLSTAKTSVINSTSLIGASALWKRHSCTVSNLSMKMDSFSYTEREEDGLPCLLDLPKEVLREIARKFSDPRDLACLGATCLELYYITEDPSLWEELTLFHFQEKQMLTFIQCVDQLEGTAYWREMFMNCCRKYGMRKIYADQVVVCSGCKTMHWLMMGHNCWSTDDKEPYMDGLSVEELIKALDL